MNRFLYLTIVCCLLVLSACAISELRPKSPEKTQVLLNLGRILYANNCQQCHGLNGEGDGPFGANLKKRPRNFTLPFDQWIYTNGDPEKVFKVLKIGIPDTPMAMFHFSDDERWALVYRIIEFSRGNKSKDFTK